MDKLMPEEPTDKMLEAGVRVIHEIRPDVHEKDVAFIYGAMFAYAPEPEAGDWKTRLVDERTQLAERLARLDAFIDSPDFKRQDKYEQKDLRHQHYVMAELLVILGSRIARHARHETEKE